MFPETRRSVIERIKSHEPGVRREAFDHLTTGYWRPAYRYLRVQWRQSPEDAEDAVQAFFTVAFEKQYLEKYDATQARFRTFLRVCLDRFVQNRQKADRAAKRGGNAPALSLDFAGAERDLPQVAAPPSDAERFFHDETVRALFGRALERIRALLSTDGRQVVFDVFERHDLMPDAATSYTTVAEALGLTVSQVTNHLHTARRLFRDAALDELRAISATDAEFRAEARELFGAEVDA